MLTNLVGAARFASACAVQVQFHPSDDGTPVPVFAPV